ncbi:MAG: hypothetical protein PHV10_09015 [Sulfuricurvum sp.]|nr:hypothetical protein [Sulfuricurvum sp.]
MNKTTKDGLWGFLGLFGMAVIYTGFKEESIFNILIGIGLLILGVSRIYDGPKGTLKKYLAWGALFWLSVGMVAVAFLTENIWLGMIFGVILMWSWKKTDSIEGAEPKQREFILGKVENYNDVIQKYVTSNESILVQCLEPHRKLFDFQSYPSKYESYKFFVGDKEYSIDEISKFIIDDDEGIKRHYATQASIKSAVGRGGQSITDAMARQRDLREARRVILEFNNTTSYLLSNVDETIAKDIEKSLIAKVSE